jgi:hypothetical protein
MKSIRLMVLTALGATLPLTAATAQAKVKLTGHSGGYKLVVPGNDVVSGTVKLTISSKAARNNKLVPWTVSCKPGKTPTKALITFAAQSNGVRTVSGPADSIGLDSGDKCTIKRKSSVIVRLTLR